MMKVTYFALRAFDEYHTGDLIPNAGDWPFISGYVSEGKIAPVLVCTLPDYLQDAVAEWEEAHADPQEAAATFIGDREDEEVEPDEEDEDDEEEEGDDEGFDPHAHTVPQVIAYLDENPDQADAVLEAELDGENPRKGVLVAIEALNAADDDDE